MMSGLALGQFFGTLHHRHEASGLVLTETSYLPTADVATHAHEDAYACFVIAGAFSTHTTARVDREVQGSRSFHPAGEEHRNRFGPTGGRVFNIQFGAGWREDLLELALWTRSVRLPPNAIGARLAAEAYRQFRKGDALAGLSLEGLSLGILAEVGRCAPTRKTLRPVWLRHALEYVHAHFRESLSLRTLAQEVGVHPVHLARTFRACHGCTVGAYVRQLRVSFASEQMRATTRSLAEIATDAGFADQSHFASTFRRALGLTPTEYRSNVSNEPGRRPVRPIVASLVQTG